MKTNNIRKDISLAISNIQPISSIIQEDIQYNSLLKSNCYMAKHFLEIKHKDILDYYFSKHKLLFSNTPSNL